MHKEQDLEFGLCDETPYLDTFVMRAGDLGQWSAGAHLAFSDLGNIETG